ncbi:MAG: sulfatase/phosphatase domain-containing protein [Planctomycetota bacterium]
MPGCQAGHRARGPVELFDIMATVMDLAGVKPRHTHFARTLAPQLAGGAGDLDRAVFAEGGYDPHEPMSFEGKDRSAGRHTPPARSHLLPQGRQQQDHPKSVCRAVMIRTLTHKLIRRTAGVNELYDLGKDPRELKNVYHSRTMAAVRRDLENRLLGLATPHRRCGALGAGSPGVAGEGIATGRETTKSHRSQVSGHKSNSRSRTCDLRLLQRCLKEHQGEGVPGTGASGRPPVPIRSPR